MKNKSVTPGMQCPVDYAFQRMGGKYKARILWQLSLGTKRYGELRRLINDITPKMLTQVLRELEDDLLIHREVYHEVPPRVEYSLKETGREMMPAIEMLSHWAVGQMERNLQGKVDLVMTQAPFRADEFI
jgi:DNA-binding HxlR family transcriptional regulator